MGWGFARAQETGKRFFVNPGFHRQGVTSGKGSSLRAKLRGKKGIIGEIQSLWGWHIFRKRFHELQFSEWAQGRIPASAAIPGQQQQSGAWNSRNAQAVSQSSDSLELMKQMQFQAPSNKENFQEAAALLRGGCEPREPRGCQHLQGSWAQLQGCCSATALLSPLTHTLLHPENLPENFQLLL